MLFTLVLSAFAAPIPGYTHDQQSDTAVLDVSQFAPECAGRTINVEIEKGGSITVVCEWGRFPLRIGDVAEMTTLIFPRPLSAVPVTKSAREWRLIMKGTRLDDTPAITRLLQDKQAAMVACLAAAPPFKDFDTVEAIGDYQDGAMTGLRLVVNKVDNPLPEAAADCIRGVLWGSDYPHHNDRRLFSFVLR